MLNVLIVGCGNIAGGFDAARPGTNTPFSHAGAYVAQGDFALRCCVDPDEVRRAAFQERWGVQQGFSYIEEVMNQGLTFDVISICSPTHFHADHLRQALLLKPRLVFCEKPMTAILLDSQELAIRYREAGIPLLINYTRRWDERVRTIREELNRGDWGCIRSVSAVYNKGLLNNGSHMLDLLTMLLGCLTIIAVGPSSADMWEADPSIPVILRSERGVTVTLNCGHAADYALFELELVTERGTIRMENGGLDWSIRHVRPSPLFPSYQILSEPTRQSGSLSGATLAAVDEIAMLAFTGGNPSCAADEAVAVQTLCEAIRVASIQNFLYRNDYE